MAYQPMALHLISQWQRTGHGQHNTAATRSPPPPPFPIHPISRHQYHAFINLSVVARENRGSAALIHADTVTRIRTSTCLG